MLTNRILAGEPLAPEQMEKVLTQFHRDGYSLIRGVLTDDEVADGGSWARFALNWPEVVIGGGTPNIQKNIIAERILGMPKD